MVGVGLIAVNFVKCIIDIILNRVAWCARFFLQASCVEDAVECLSLFIFSLF